MAHPDSWVPGTIGSLVHYYDEELLVPSIETLEFESRATSEDGRPMWLFREPNSELVEKSELVLDGVTTRRDDGKP